MDGTESRATPTFQHAFVLVRLFSLTVSTQLPQRHGLQAARDSNAYCDRHANHSAFGGIIPHFRRFSAIPHGICEILLFHSIHLSHKNLVFSYINLQKLLSPDAICQAQIAP